MAEYLWIAIIALFASLMSFYSGFGLGTVLMPAMALFLPLPTAIGLTAIVHLLHNLLKTGLLWKTIDWTTAIRFGSTALLASIPGALLLKKLSDVTPIGAYSFLGIQGEVSWLRICIGLLLILFATTELFPRKIYRIHLLLGGAISGFFGGLSGNQGAFRSIFLIHTNLDKKAFIGTNAAIAAVVDMVRLIVYGLSFRSLFMARNMPFLVVITAAGALGDLIGLLLLPKVAISFIRNLIAALLYLFGTLLILGII